MEDLKNAPEMSEEELEAYRQQMNQLHDGSARNLPPDLVSAANVKPRKTVKRDAQGALLPGVRFLLPVWDEARKHAGDREVECMILQPYAHTEGFGWFYVAEAPEPVTVYLADGRVKRSADIYAEIPQEQFLVFDQDLVNNERFV